MRRLPIAAALLSATLALAGAAGAAPSPSVAAPAVPRVTRPTYQNPVTARVADTFADPAVIRGLDGWWYAFGTSDPLLEGQTTARQLPVLRSRDLAAWSYVGDAFRDATRPTWAADGAGLWAPDVRYVDGQYRMYYVVTDTTATASTGDSAIGLATAPSPAGPWTDSGAPVVAPRPGAGGTDFLWTFDPSVVTDTDGRSWIFFGSYYGGVHVQRLTADGRRTVGPDTLVAIDNKFEGAYPVRHGGYWYLFVSTANCCAGPTTGYSVQVGRSRSITGPYRDAEGVRLDISRAGGTPVLNQNGNRWIGAGHNAVVTDLAGQDWIAYHAIDRGDPYLNGTDGINERPMLLDRLDWVDGWPVTRAGRGPSDGERRGPATGGRWATTVDAALPVRWDQTGSWRRLEADQSGGYLEARQAGELRGGPVGSSARVTADLRSGGAAYGLAARTSSATVRVLLDPAKDTLQLQQLRGSSVVGSERRALPDGFRTGVWHGVSLRVQGGEAVAEVTEGGAIGGPLVTARLDLRGGGAVRSAGVVATGGGVGVDNLSVLPAARARTRVAPERIPGRLDPTASDSFSGGSLADGWTWVRKDAAATVARGVLRWPTQAGDLVGTRNDAGLLLRSPGAGDWTVQTRVSLDLGTDTVRNFSQAGLVAYVDDDLFTRLSHVAIWNTRQTEFGIERPYAGRLSYGGTIVGPPAQTTWLRITHHRHRGSGEHRLRAWTSRDGRTWVKGGVWTLPAGADIKVGLVSHGGAGATAEFSYFRLYR